VELTFILSAPRTLVKVTNIANNNIQLGWLFASDVKDFAGEKDARRYSHDEGFSDLMRKING